MLEKLKSRKFIIAIIFAILEVVKKELGLSIPTEAVYVVLVWLLGQSAIDVAKEIKS